jgi:L-2-hydroxyglutarate oxidase LhgO
METSSRNSGVIHGGMYYKPGTLKARLCVEGREALYALCAKHHIPHRAITKLITATNETELEKLEQIRATGEKNGVALQLLGREETLKLEPNICTVGALFSSCTGIVSIHDLMDYFYHTVLEQGGIVQHRCRVSAIRHETGTYTLEMDEAGTSSTLSAEIVINAAGLQSDLVAESAGIDIDRAGYRLCYAKGSYFSIRPAKRHLVERLVYPVPQNEGLGVHALIDWGDQLKFGPDVEYLPDRKQDYAVDMSKQHAFAESIRRILPMIEDEDISPDMSGIRPKLQRQGEAAKDFIIRHETERGLPGLVTLVGIESPGLTSSPAIARYVEMLLFGDT